MAQDHTFDVVKNYVRRLGAFALWDVATETGEIATAVLVTSTKTQEYAHAAEQLIARTAFAPAAMYSDTWPAKDDFWIELLGEDIGRLGLFHFLRRILKTLRQNHKHFHRALTDLLFAIYTFYPDDYEKLLTALKNGTLNGKLHSETDIAELQATKKFRQRYNKYLRKEIREAQTIATNLHQWHAKYKVKASEGATPAEGELDDHTGQTLFTTATRDAVINCQHNAVYLQDMLSQEAMYRELKPPPHSKHRLSEWLSNRAESKLEKYHASLANFGNSGMDRELCDCLNLCGTARYNLHIRHRIALSETQMDEKWLPVAWQTVVSYNNHTQLAHINKLAREAGAEDVPFKWVEPLPEDNGERFFSEYLEQRKQIVQDFPNQQNDRCPCSKCATTQEQKQQQPVVAKSPNLKPPPGVQPQQNTMPHLNAVIPNMKPPPAAVMTQRNPTPHPNPKPPPLPPPRFNENPMLQPPPAPVYAPPVYTPFPFAFQHQQQAPPQQPRTIRKEFCCGEFANWWVYKRFGRPPHDDHCFVSINRKKNS
jgi:hypothetical protein